ncbi:DUF3159 domain-containing protein [Brachybacterium phenoliresistens]|uniref:DUF3159 domain-containing protein n=1 Tax=Brachybacterium phenoliresistens TaxID=396014 RepID=Z9JYH7_9MICO|nr:DUF3159 domain-containing protein [Brachybacterium phenoliresistens]EWS82871.1 hypothetical protein BF93_07575 [Brachybacterium phenoliresistens]
MSSPEDPRAEQGGSPRTPPAAQPDAAPAAGPAAAPAASAAGPAASAATGAAPADAATGPDGAPRRGLAAVLQEEQFSVRDAMGGPRGILESVLPTLLFLVLYVITRDVKVSAIAAVAVVVIALLARLVARQSLSSVLGGLFGVVIGAVWAIRTGEGSDLFAPGLVINAVTLVILLISLLARRPLLGLVISLLDGRVADWAEDPDARRVYTRATAVFIGLYAAKLLVQLPLYLAGAVAALGVAKLVMGLPLFALAAWIVWLMHRALLVRREARALRSQEPGAAPPGPSPSA